MKQVNTDNHILYTSSEQPAEVDLDLIDLDDSFGTISIPFMN